MIKNLINKLFFIAVMPMMVHCSPGAAPSPSPPSSPSGSTSSTPKSNTDCSSLNPSADTKIKKSMMVALENSLNYYFLQLVPDFSSPAEVTFNCQEGGNIDFKTKALVKKGSDSVEGKIEMNFDNCREPFGLLLNVSSNVTKFCDFTAATSGIVTCNWKGSYYEAPPQGNCGGGVDEPECMGHSYSYEFDCSTTDPCSGLTSDGGDGNQSAGLSLKIWQEIYDDVIGGGAPQGALCIGGTEFNVGD